MTENRGQMTEDRGQKTEIRWPICNFGVGVKQTEPNILMCNLSSVVCLLSSEP
jgi:hypothetical protein